MLHTKAVMPDTVDLTPDAGAAHPQAPHAAVLTTGVVAWFVACYTLASLLWLLLRPGPPALYIAVISGFPLAGPLVLLPFCVRATASCWGTGASSLTAGARIDRWALVAICFSLGVTIVGLALYYPPLYHVRLVEPMESTANTWLMGVKVTGGWPPVTLTLLAFSLFIAAHVMAVLGLMIPSRPLSVVVRTRIVIDGMLVVASLAIWIWYAAIGPMLTHSRVPVLTQLMVAGYIVSDLVLVFCFLAFTTRRRYPQMVPLVATCLLGYCLTHALQGAQVIRAAPAIASMVQVGLTWAMMTTGLIVFALRDQLRYAPPVVPSTPVETSGPARARLFNQVLFPYVLFPLVGVLVFNALARPDQQRMWEGLVVGFTVLTVLILVRQVFVILENHRLYADLEARTRQVEQHAARVEALNDALEAANQRLQALALTDYLTELPNHRALVTAIDTEIARTRRYGQPCALSVIDLDHFKQLNDHYGHQMGDTALHTVARTLRGALRPVDVVGRWGGEEFIVLMPDTNREQALRVADRLRGLVAVSPVAGGSEARVTLSAGVAVFPADGDTRDMLIAAADQALYLAKQMGRNQVRSAAQVATGAG
jgi:diguanylate cyclase (GGDEF)-like protein